MDKITNVQELAQLLSEDHHLKRHFERDFRSKFEETVEQYPLAQAHREAADRLIDDLLDGAFTDPSDIAFEFADRGPILDYIEQEMGITFGMAQGGNPL
jgi:hypothetical protein